MILVEQTVDPLRSVAAFLKILFLSILRHSLTSKRDIPVAPLVLKKLVGFNFPQYYRILVHLLKLRALE